MNKNNLRQIRLWMKTGSNESSFVKYSWEVRGGRQTGQHTSSIHKIFHREFVFLFHDVKKKARIYGCCNIS